MADNLFGRVRNYVFPTSYPSTNDVPVMSRKADAQHPSRYILPSRLERIKQDVGRWRDAVREAEQVYFPYRVRMQQIFIDVVLNGHVQACMQRRQDMTLQKEFAIVDKNGAIDEEATALFKEMWFHHFVKYTLDALAFGYSLVSLGDIVQGSFPELSIVRRYNVSPDRHVIDSMMYANAGIRFLDPASVDEKGQRYVDWTVWVPTPTEVGSSICGFGYLYSVALYEIMLRNNLSANADFQEVFGMPYRVGKTTKTKEDERAEFEALLRGMGSAGYALLDLGDEINFLEAKGNDGSWQSFENFEQRLEKKISKIILGHADALDSVPGKLGAETSVEQALGMKATADNKFVEHVVNSQLIPKLINLGFKIPLGKKFVYLNNQEKHAHQMRQAEYLDKLATALQKFSAMGVKPPIEWVNEQTGIMFEEKQEEPETEDVNDLPSGVKNRLNILYS